MDNLVVNNIRQRPLRALISVAGVALGVALVMLFTGLSRGMSNDLQRRSSNLRAEIIFTRPGGLELTSSTANVSTKYVDELRKVDGVESAVPAIRYIFEGGRGFGFEFIEGVEWQPFAEQNGLQLVDGRAPAAADEIVIDETKAQNNKMGVGGTLSIFGGKPYRIVGVYSPEAGARVKMTLAAMQDVMESPGKCSYIFVKARPGIDAVDLARRIEANEKTRGNKVQFTSDLPMFNFEKSIPFLGVFLRALVGLSAIVSGLVVMLAMYTTITERTREIGVLKALGASRGYIVSLIEREALVISLLGLVVGFAASLAAGFLIHRAYGLPFEYGWRWAVVAALIGVGGGVLGALYPAMRAASLDAVTALSYE
ncbi:MAG: putative transport system permease protein [Acidobacteriota bacterium]|jgi:putative ABC transport system permease protein|nr:putative transport system permease protein [Acidobacteriota bacterium]